jgi:hypothetical protein
VPRENIDIIIRRGRSTGLGRGSTKVIAIETGGRQLEKRERVAP